MWLRYAPLWGYGGQLPQFFGEYLARRGRESGNPGTYPQLIFGAWFVLAPDCATSGWPRPLIPPCANHGQGAGEAKAMAHHGQL